MTDKQSYVMVRIWQNKVLIINIDIIVLHNPVKYQHCRNNALQRPSIYKSSQVVFFSAHFRKRLQKLHVAVFVIKLKKCFWTFPCITYMNMTELIFTASRFTFYFNYVITYNNSKLKTVERREIKIYDFFKMDQVYCNNSNFYSDLYIPGHSQANLSNSSLNTGSIVSTCI